MSWWTIIKQGKILTLPKTKLRIKKPTKIEERKCKDKLLEYQAKLLNSFGDMHLRPLLNQPEYYLEESDEKFETGHILPKSTGKGKDITGGYYDLEVGEYIWASNRELIEALPEEVCCLALDVMKLSGEHRKKIAGYRIYWRNEMKPIDIDLLYIHPSLSQDLKMWEGGQSLMIYDDKTMKKGCELEWFYHIPSEGFLPKPPKIDWVR